MSQGLLQGDMLSTSQYYEGRRQRVIEEPILRLMLAVFATAWADASYDGSLRMCVQQLQKRMLNGKQSAGEHTHRQQHITTTQEQEVV